jgi:ribonuclease HI
MDQIEERVLTIYADGSSYSSPRAGGMGYVFVVVGEEGLPRTYEDAPPGWKRAINNRWNSRLVWSR